MINKSFSILRFFYSLLFWLLIKLNTAIDVNIFEHIKLLSESNGPEEAYNYIVQNINAKKVQSSIIPQAILDSVDGLYYYNL